MKELVDAWIKLQEAKKVVNCGTCKGSHMYNGKDSIKYSGRCGRCQGYSLYVSIFENDKRDELIEALFNRLTEIGRVANNALYFQDSSDYNSALWNILKMIEPDEFDDDGIRIDDLQYREE